MEDAGTVVGCYCVPAPSYLVSSYYSPSGELMHISTVDEFWGGERELHSHPDR